MLRASSRLLRVGASAPRSVARLSLPGIPSPSAFPAAVRSGSSGCSVSSKAGSAVSSRVPLRREVVVDSVTPRQRNGADANAPLEMAPSNVMEADSRVVLVVGALACLFGSITAVYVAVTHDPNKKEDRPILKRGEYLAGASVVGACALVFITLRR